MQYKKPKIEFILNVLFPLGNDKKGIYDWKVLALKLIALGL